MESIGEKFKNIRESKNLSLRFVAGNTTTSSFLSKFERGISGISLDTLMPVLRNMNMTTSEFLNYVIDADDSYYTLQINALRKLSMANDTQKLIEKSNEENELWGKTHDITHQHLALIAKALWCENEGKLLEPYEQKQIQEYLFNAEVFYHYELIMINYTLSALPIEYQIQMGKEMFNKLPNNYFVTEYRDIITMIINNIIISCIEEEYYEVAAEYIAMLKSNFDSSVYYRVHVQLKFFQGLLFIQKGQIVEGTRLANFTITVMDEIGNKEKAADYRVMLDKYLNKLNISN
ncbi:helix-turn-helix domain-containing protein [Periweissella cryptocerci]|nr:Rgg/GadR/MutR family transcriptional regulator [Periweissella cryptocerci]